ncbi:MAG TPA: penicillin-binding transpeptidase domain-containing protein, partial [Candidatus Acidoferrales bacterium]|nr:penicillin-binding transpeptidase domain-containing protein [Candidatus Acidoferrales bacterium]
EPLGTAPANVEASEAPYFVDLVNDRLLARYSEEELVTSSYRINTTLDLRLQQAAADALSEALPEVDAKIKQRFSRRKEPPPEVQAALVAIDPHTGAVKALIGGRDYNVSQLNHVVAHRQPGSSFKPFVYAAAFAASLEKPENAITPITTVVDEPTIFEFEGQRYEPSNYGEQFFGIVTVRDALIHSMNVATVKVAEMTGYDRVADLAVAAGLNARLRPTPAVSLGAYDSTPLEVAGAYTIFANGGVHLDPFLISTVLDSEGNLLQVQQPNPQLVLDPRVAYLVVDLLQDAINRGTGAGARARGFTAPAAGKTGTSRDAWFIGFTSNLLCLVWVGFDDGRDLGLPGAAAALPIWTAFMTRAVTMPAYRNVEEFIAPEGIVTVPLDPETLSVATPDCPEARMEKFIVGTEPRELCPRHRPSKMRQVTRTLLRAIGIGRREESKKEDGQAETTPGRESKSKEGGGPPPLSQAEEIDRGNGMLRRATSALGQPGQPAARAAPLREQKKGSSPPPPE